MRNILSAGLALAACLLLTEPAWAQGRGNAHGQGVRQQTPGHLMRLDPAWRETVREQRGASRFAPGRLMRQDPDWREAVRSRRGASRFAPGQIVRQPKAVRGKGGKKRFR